jgi:mono/diheme cytochrome c family protein
MNFRALGLVVAIVLLVGAVAYGVLAWKPEIAAVARPDPASFDAQLIERGAQLAAIGNCNVCHTVPGGEPFAGGLGVHTQFGTVYSTNITPDEDTGIGTWSDEAFHRAMHEGVGRNGEHLYPAFPYDHLTIVSADDNRALYAYLMSREPVVAEAPANELVFPLNSRLLVAGWKLLYFRPGAFAPDTSQSDEWNRGAYLAEGLGHCGACHTPRNAFGASERDRHFDGSEVEGWHAYAINENSPAPVPWTAEALAFYLQHGWHEQHGVSRGSMAPVTANLGSVAEADVEAIAAYVASHMGAEVAQAEAGEQRTDVPVQSADSQIAPASIAAAPANMGEAIYDSACAICHEAGRALPQGGLDLSRSTAVHSASPQNVINVTLFGLPAADGDASPVMPGFMGTLTEDQMVALLDHLRETFSDRPPWTDSNERVAATMSGEKLVTVYRSDGRQSTPPVTQMRTAPWQ